MKYLLTTLAITCLLAPSIGCRSASWWPWQTASNAAPNNSPLATAQPDITLPSEVATADTENPSAGQTAPANAYPVAQAGSNTAPSYESTAPAYTPQNPPAANATASAQTGPYDVNAYGGGSPAGSYATAPPANTTPPAYSTTAPSYTPPTSSGGGTPPAYDAKMPSYQATPAEPPAGHYAVPADDRYGPSGSDPVMPESTGGYTTGSRYDNQAQSNPAPYTPPAHSPPASSQAPDYSQTPNYSTAMPSNDRYGNATQDAYSSTPAESDAPAYTPVETADSRGDYRGSTTAPRNATQSPERSQNSPDPARQPSGFRPGGTGDYIPPVRSGSSSKASAGTVVPADYTAPAGIQMPVSTDADASAYHGTIMR